MCVMVKPKEGADREAASHLKDTPTVKKRGLRLRTECSIERLDGQFIPVEKVNEDSELGRF